MFVGSDGAFRWPVLQNAVFFAGKDCPRCFYLWEYVNGKFYESNPQSLGE